MVRSVTVRSVARLLQHLQDMSFFDAAAIPEHLIYVSGFRVLEEGGLRALLDLLRRELHAQSANVVILDGFVAVGESAESDREFKKFVHELHDYMMPLLDGAGVLKAMRAAPKLAAVPVIMMTAVPESVVRARC